MRHISRELHDDFGQILTAMGMMLGRARNQLPEGSQLRTDLLEVREIAQTTLDKVRSLSQALHPVMLDEAGLEPTIEWYLPVVERQSRNWHILREIGSPVSHSRQCGSAYLSRSAGSVEQCDAPFGSEESLGALAFHARRIAASSGRPRLGIFCQRRRGKELAWWPCASVRNCWAATISITRPAEGGTLVSMPVPRERLEPNV